MPFLSPPSAGTCPSLKSPLALGKAKNGLYFFCPRCHKCPPADANIASHVKCQLVPSPFNCCKISSVRNKYQSSSQNVKYLHAVNKETYVVDTISCSIVNSSSGIYSTHNLDTEFLWHSKLGHVPFVKMKTISTIPLNFSSKQLFTFIIYPMARQTRMRFPKSTTTIGTIFELLHIDL